MHMLIISVVLMRYNSTALIGMTLGGSLGFLADNILGSEEGYTTFENKGWGSAVEYAFGKLASGNFSRYGITVLMDMFVSLILFEPTFKWLISGGENSYFFGCDDSTKAIANGVVSSIISMITFNAYANQTRFLWAYPDKGQENVISTPVILLAATTLSILFLISDTGKGGINSPNMKLVIVYTTLLSMSLLYMMGYMSPNVEEDEDDDDDLTKGEKYLENQCNVRKFASKGKFAFLLIAIITLFGTYATRKVGDIENGCNKYFQPIMALLFFSLLASTNGFSSLKCCFGNMDSECDKDKFFQQGVNIITIISIIGAFLVLMNKYGGMPCFNIPNPITLIISLFSNLFNMLGSVFRSFNLGSLINQYPGFLSFVSLVILILSYYSYDKTVKCKIQDKKE